MPVSIFPVAEYLWSSLSVLRKSGKYFWTTSATTALSNRTFSLVRISRHRSKNCAAICCLFFPRTLQSITVVLECSGSIILFLKLQVKINLQFFWNSSIEARNNNCTSCVVLSASSMMITLCLMMRSTILLKQTVLHCYVQCQESDPHLIH